MTGSTELRCSVVIPTHARAESLRQVLHALRVQTSRDFEVLVVVDGEDAATRTLSTSLKLEFPLEWIFLETRQGQANARNVGVQRARAPYIAFLDDDTLPAPEWLERHVLAHVADGDWVRVVRGKIWHSFARPNGVVEQFLRDEQRKLEEEFGTRGADITIRECCVGVNCSLKREAFLAAGGFDVTLSEMDEDMELGTRLFLRGARFVYEPGAMAEHRDTKLLFEYYMRCWRGAANTGLYRLTAKGERTEQLRALTLRANGRGLQRVKERYAWRSPEHAKQMAERMRRVAEASGSNIAAKLWRSLVSSAEYWDEVRKTGLDGDALQEAIGWPVVTLAFHSVAPLERGDDPKYCVTPVKFARMMEWMAEHGYDCQPAGACGRQRRFEITFDDAYEELYRELLPSVARWQLRPLVFVVAGQMGGSNEWDNTRARARRLLTCEQMREMQRAGVQFGSHSMTHADLIELSDADLRREVRDSKARLEETLGVEVSAFAYPYGRVDERVRAAVGEAGYKRAYTVYPGRNWFGDPLLLKRTEVGEADSMAMFAHKVKHGASARERIAQHVPQGARRVLRMIM